MKERMRQPALVLPGVMQSLTALAAAIKKSGLPTRTLDPVYLRASQINGCSFCVEMHATDLKKAGETDARIFSVAAWRDAPSFTDAERAALALTEAATRIADRAEPVPDEIWNEAARHYNEQELAALVVSVGAINLWNRLNVTTRQVAGSIPVAPGARAVA
jgi:AhpD family alkylhydroperoxidase